MSVATETVQLDLRPTARDLIDRAARSVGMDRAQFMADACRREAESVLLDQRLFSVEGGAFDAFSAALDAPPTGNADVRRLLSTPSPWER